MLPPQRIIVRLKLLTGVITLTLQGFAMTGRKTGHSTDARIHFLHDMIFFTKIMGVARTKIHVGIIRPQKPGTLRITVD